MNLHLKQLKAFLGVAETSNFTKTAQKLHMSQAALSSAIRELESQLDCALFERTTRNVELTQAGHQFLQTAARVVQELEWSTMQLKEIHRNRTSRLRVGFTPTLASHAVPEMLESFRASHPQVTVDLIDEVPRRLQELVESGAIDAAFGAFFQKASGIEQLPLAPSTLVLVHSGQESAITLNAEWKIFEEHALIALSDATPVQQLLQSALKKHNVKARPAMTVSHLETAVALAEKGFGVTVIPSFATAVCRRYKVGIAHLGPPVRFNFCRIVKMGKSSNENLESFTNLVIDRLTQADRHGAPDLPLAA
jgi:DNA-binding transcriptional LysR family regulator